MKTQIENSLINNQEDQYGVRYFNYSYIKTMQKQEEIIYIHIYKINLKNNIRTIYINTFISICSNPRHVVV